MRHNITRKGSVSFPNLLFRLLLSSICGSRLNVALVDRNLEKAFWSYVNRDPLNYYFFITDFKFHPDQTKIWLAIEAQRIQGLLLVYRDYVVQFRGSRKAVRLLLDQVTLDKVDLQAPLGYDDIVLEKFTPKVKEEIVLMNLSRGEENILITATPERLSIKDAEEISQIMRNEDPVWWGETTAERLRLGFTEAVAPAYWLGIRRDQKIVSAGMTRIVDSGSNISIVVTRKGYRNLGYATSIVSALVKEILKTSSTALIHVLSDNTSAIRTYSKVGFKPYRSYLSIHT